MQPARLDGEASEWSGTLSTSDYTSQVTLTEQEQEIVAKVKSISMLQTCLILRSDTGTGLHVHSVP